MQNPFDPGYYESAELRRFGFRAVGDNVAIARNCTIIGLAHIALGDHVRIDGFTTIVAVGGRLTIGNRVHIGGYCHLAVSDELTFGDFSGTSQGVRIYTANDDYTGQALVGPMIPAEYRKLTRAPVTVGRYAVLGSGTIVLPGGDIGEGSVVGALSLVTKPLAPWGVYFGIPAKRLKGRSRKLLAAEAELLAKHGH